MNKETTMQLVTQPDGISCGPTSIAMIHRTMLGASSGLPFLEVGHIGSMCGTNSLTGTTHEGVAVAFQGLGIDAMRTLGPDAARYALGEGLAAGGFVLCRTLTHGAKHWIVAWGRRNGRIRIADPWLGHLELTDAETMERISHRDHEVWLVPCDQKVRDVRVLPLGSDADHYGRIMEIVVEAFGRYMPQGLEAFVLARTEWDASRRIEVDGETVGVYLLKPANLPSGLDRSHIDRTEGMRGVEGIALAVHPDFRGGGYGRILKDEPRRNGFDFVWGEQLKALGNIDDWTKRRQLLREWSNSYLTAEIFGDKFDVEPKRTVASSWWFG